MTQRGHPGVRADGIALDMGPMFQLTIKIKKFYYYYFKIKIFFNLSKFIIKYYFVGLIYHVIYMMCRCKLVKLRCVDIIYK